MFPHNYQQKILNHRLLIFIITTSIFIAAFVINVLMNQPLYNANLNVIPKIQTSQGWGSDQFLVFMNVVSNIFNPLVCAGYIILFFIISYRKLQILVFLIWFIFLSWILSILKMIFHQARPFWIQGSGVQMLEWTCYTEYGMPSGHAMMAIILLQFIIRFYARVNKYVSKYISIFYILAFCFQICVMFSRVILGMHSFNQVLLGLLIGCYTFVPYYLFVQRLILKWVLFIFRSQKSFLTVILLLCLSCLSICTQVLLALLLPFKNTSYINVISLIKGCKGFLIYKSFQYKCLEDSALFMAGIGILAAFNYMKNPSYLNLKLDYTRISFRFLGKIILTLLFPGITLAIFLNPLWNRLDLQDDAMSLVIWGCQVSGFFLAPFVLIYLISIINHKLGFELYRMPQSYQDFKQHQVINMIQSVSFVIKRAQQKKRETELTEGSNVQSLIVTRKVQINQSLKQQQ